VAFFADPLLFLRLREVAVPDLRTWPWPIVWVSGCGHGELAYALAVLLREEGVLGRTMLYATASTDAELEVARRGVYQGCDWERLDAAYRAAGGRSSLSEYCRKDGDQVTVRPTLRDRMAFFQHDPLIDGSPNEFQMIVSGVGLDRLLPDDVTRVLGLYHGSLCRFGSLALMRATSLALHPRRSSYAQVETSGHLHRRMR
jgi:chemotaxis protein methyltransferase CheR